MAYSFGERRFHELLGTRVNVKGLANGITDRDLRSQRLGAWLGVGLKTHAVTEYVLPFLPAGVLVAWSIIRVIL